MEVQRVAADPGVAVEVLELADLGPGQVDAEGDDDQQQVHDPDAEILAAAGRELDRVAFRGGVDRRFGVHASYLLPRWYGAGFCTARVHLESKRYNDDPGWGESLHETDRIRCQPLCAQGARGHGRKAARLPVRDRRR